MNLYGWTVGELHEKARELSGVLGLELELHDSLFRGGDYYLVREWGEYEFILQCNFVDVEGELAEPDYPEHSLIFYANGSDGQYFSKLDGVVGLELLSAKTVAPSMSEVVLELEALRLAWSAGELSLEDVGPAFERLTFGLTRGEPADERALASLVNDIERIRFTQLPETQHADIAEVLTQAVDIVARFGPGTPS